jgi:uncharacterized membrane protein
LQKHKQMIDARGGWGCFRNLSAALKPIADKHRVGVANIGVRYVLDQSAMAGVIIDAGLGTAQHIADNARTFISPSTTPPALPLMRSSPNSAT